VIFDDIPPPDHPPSASGGSTRRRRRRSSASSGEGLSRRRRRSSFREASRLDVPVREAKDRNHTAWLVVLGLLVVAAIGFAWSVQQERRAPVQLSGEAPSGRLVPLIDPILAPLETGEAGFSGETLATLEADFEAARDRAALDNKDIYSTAATITRILGEALEDRGRHIERLVRLGSPVRGVPPDPQARTDIPEAERRHLELAVGVSWQRNSVTYRNRVEELWYRLQRFESGRFGPSKNTPL
jgi:hypothetical protein